MPDWQDSFVVTSYTDVRTNVSRIAKTTKTKLSPRSVPPMHIVGAIAFRPLALRCAKAMITQMGFHAMPSGTWLEGCVTQLVNPLSAFSLIAVRGFPQVRAGWTLPGRQPGPRPVVAAGPRPGHPGWTLRVCSVTDRAGPALRRPDPAGAGLAGARPPPAPALILPCTSAFWRGRRCARVPLARRPGGCPAAAAGRLPGGRRPPKPRGPPAPRAGRIPAGPAPGPPLRTAAVAGPWPASVAVTMAGPGPIRPGQPLQPNAAPHSPRRAVITAPFMCGPAWPQCTCSAHFPYHGFHGVIR